MAISRSEMKLYFEEFDILVDDPSKSLGCFKCGEYLYYKNRRYRCDNKHKFKYQAMVLIHAGFMHKLADSVSNNGVCKNML